MKSTGAIAVMRLAAAAGLVSLGRVGLAQLRSNAVLEASSLKALVEAFGGEPPQQSDQVLVLAPDVAEDGFMVSLGGESLLPQTESISLLVADNPSVMAAHFELSGSVSPKIETRVKTSGSGNVLVLVKAQGRYFYAEKYVKVIAGGCGS